MSYKVASYQIASYQIASYLGVHPALQMLHHSLMCTQENKSSGTFSCVTLKSNS